MTSFETAQKLKVAGFPQPEPAEGQFWYNAFEDRFVVISMSDRRAFVGYCGHTKTAAILLDQFAFSIFAPTATDILEQLNTGPQDYDGRNLSGGGFVGA